MDRQQLLLKFQAEAIKAVSILKQSDGIELKPNDIYRCLIDFFEVSDTPTEVFFRELNAGEMANAVRRRMSTPPCLGIIAFNVTILPNGVPSYFEKAQVRMQGEIWTIHLADSDGFPSNPHAHNYQNNYKLHLGNGLLYRRREIISHISKKNLMTIRSRIVELIPNIQLPPLSE